LPALASPSRARRNVDAVCAWLPHVGIVDFVQFAKRHSFCAERVVPHDSDNLLFLILPFRIEGFGLGVEINAEELFHVYGIRSFKRGSENRPKELFHVEMTCGARMRIG